MRKISRLISILSIPILSATAFCTTALAQDATRGVLMPFTVTGGTLVTDRGKAADPESTAFSAGFRAVLYPSLRLNRNWFVASTVDVHSEPFFYYEASYPGKAVEAQVQQLLLGYTRIGENSSLTVKVGRLNTAFGAFPLRYSDKVNPLLDQPFAYAYPVKLRPDQLPCGVHDLMVQGYYPAYVEHYCGGSTVEREGMVPVTLYGIPGAEIGMNWHRIDARFQATNSSPANPQSVNSGSQHLQWTAGAGFTIQQGFRVGVSGFKGPFLENDVVPYLSPDASVADFPATGIGAELKWARGRWSTYAEWDRTEFTYPRFLESPAVSNSYVEVRAILTPRFYTAVRAGYQNYGPVEDIGGGTADHFLPNRQSYELAVGYHVNHFQTLKVGYEWLKTNGQTGTRNNVFGIQFVTSVNSLSRAF